jgi:probable F420-dependent oxidoreductase
MSSRARTKIGLANFGGTIDAIVRVAKEAEDANFDAIWIPEFNDRSATVPLAAVAAATSRIDIGSAIMYAFGRVPLVLAAEARDLDRMSDGRMTLGLGAGTRKMQQEWLGQDGLHPAPRLEELIPLLRSLWSLHEGPVHHEGRFYRVNIDPTHSPNVPLRQDIPIYVGAVNERMLEAVGRVADGLLSHPLCSPEYLQDSVRPALMRGAQRSGRPMPVVAGYLICSIDEDSAAARRRAAAQIAFYAVTKTYHPMLIQSGFDEEVEAIRARWEANDQVGMVSAVSSPMIDALALAGTPDEVLDHYRARWEGLYDSVVLYPPTFGDAADIEIVIETFAQ